MADVSEEIGAALFASERTEPEATDEQRFEALNSNIEVPSHDARDRHRLLEAQEAYEKMGYGRAELPPTMGGFDVQKVRSAGEATYASFDPTKKPRGVTGPGIPGEWLGRPLRDGLKAGPLTLGGRDTGEWQVRLAVQHPGYIVEFGPTGASLVATEGGSNILFSGATDTIDQLTRDWLASLANLEAE